MSPFHVDPQTHLGLMTSEVPAYRELHERIAAAKPGSASDQLGRLRAAGSPPSSSGRTTISRCS